MRLVFLGYLPASYGTMKLGNSALLTTTDSNNNNNNNTNNNNSMLVMYVNVFRVLKAYNVMEL